MRPFPALLTCVALGACCSPRPPEHRPIVDAEARLEAHNDIASRTSRLWAATNSNVWYVDADGRGRRDQVEGFVGYAAPDRAFLQASKLHEPFFVLGCDGREAWWIDLARDEPRARIAPLDALDEEHLESLGLPVHPLDLVDLIALRPIDAGSAARDSAADADGWACFRAPERRGFRRVWLDERGLARRAQVLDPAGGVVAEALLSRHESADGVPVPTSIDIMSPPHEFRMLMRLYAPRTSGRRPLADVFLSRTFIDRHRVRDIETIGAAGAPAGAQP